MTDRGTYLRHDGPAGVGHRYRGRYVAVTCVECTMNGPWSVRLDDTGDSSTTVKFVATNSAGTPDVLHASHVHNAAS